MAQSCTARELQDLKEPELLNFIWFLQLEIPFFSSKRLFPLGLPGTCFERGPCSKLIPDLLPHRGSGVLSSPSPSLSLLSVSNGASSPAPILMLSNMIPPLSLNSVAWAVWKLYLLVELSSPFSNKEVPFFSLLCTLCPAWHYACHITHNTYLFSELNLS